jgi:hypothetical protein
VEACETLCEPTDTSREEPTVTKKYDPMWELAGQKVALHGMEEHMDSRCPVCHVTVHLERTVRTGDRVECGLCGERLLVEQKDGRLALTGGGQ